MTLFSDLVEQATQRSNELAAHAEAVASEAAAVLDGATQIELLARQEAEAVHKDMAEALAAITHAQEQVHEAAGQAGGVIDDIPARADTAEAAVKELLAAVREDVTHLSELRARLLSTVDASEQQVNAEFHDLDLRVQELQTRLEARLDEAEAEVKELRQAVETAHTDLEERHRSVIEGLHTLSTRATALAHAFGDSLEAVTVVVGRSVVAMLNAAVEAHNEAQQSLRTSLTNETPSAPDPDQTWVTQAVQPLSDAVSTLELVPPAAVDALKAAAESIVHEAGEALESLSAIAHSLEQAVPHVSTVGS